MVQILNISNKKIYSMSNEFELQLEVVKILRKSGLLFSCTHTTEMLDTDAKRIDAKKNGYSVGMPDILVYTSRSSFSGMCLELKHPWGIGEISSNQRKILKELEANNWLVVVSNDLVQIAETIVLYKNNLIEIEL